MEGTLNQPYLFAASIYCGMTCGAVYTALFGLRRFLAKSRLWLVLCDILFSLLTFFAAVLMLWLVCNIALRVYHFIGIAIGYGLFKAGLWPLLSALWRLFHRSELTDTSKKS